MLLRVKLLCNQAPVNLFAAKLTKKNNKTNRVAGFILDNRHCKP